MSEHVSKHLSEKQLSGLEKLGDVMLPGFEDMPGFATVKANRHADRVLDHMGAKDLADLKMLLGLLAVMPRIFVKWLVGFLELSPSIPGPLGSFLRFMRIGIRGLVMTLYYSDPVVVRLVGYDASVYTADLQPAESGSRASQELPGLNAPY